MPSAATCEVVLGLQEDFKQLSEEAPSEGLTTIPAQTSQGED